MTSRWRDLAATLARGGYSATMTDRHWGATAPLDPLPCRCGSRWPERDVDGELRCFKCGAVIEEEEP